MGSGNQDGNLYEIISPNSVITSCFYSLTNILYNNSLGIFIFLSGYYVTLLFGLHQTVYRIIMHNTIWYGLFIYSYTMVKTQITVTNGISTY